MKLIDILVQELPKRGGWPEGAKTVAQDSCGEVWGFNCGAPKINNGLWWTSASGTDLIPSSKAQLDLLADDWKLTFITREQYEAALASSKECAHDWIYSEGRTACGYLCRKCGDYNGPESEVKADGDGWIEWGGGECPVDAREMVDVIFGHGGRMSANIADCWRWTHEGTDSDIIAYRLHKLQEVTEADDEADLNECVGQDVAPEWNGEGLPPVGCECEYSLNGGKTWWKCKIDYIVGTQGVVMLCDTFEGVQYVQFSSYGNALKFRPIRSEADKKRDAAIEFIAGAIDSHGIDPLKSAVFIYDAIAAGEMPGVKLED